MFFKLGNENSDLAKLLQNIPNKDHDVATKVPFAQNLKIDGLEGILKIKWEYLPQKINTKLVNIMSGIR